MNLNRGSTHGASVRRSFVGLVPVLTGELNHTEGQGVLDFVGCYECVDESSLRVLHEHGRQRHVERPLGFPVKTAERIFKSRKRRLKFVVRTKTFDRKLMTFEYKGKGCTRKTEAEELNLRIKFHT